MVGFQGEWDQLWPPCEAMQVGAEFLDSELLGFTAFGASVKLYLCKLISRPIHTFGPNLHTCLQRFALEATSSIPVLLTCQAWAACL